MWLIQRQNMTVCELLGKTENSLMTLLAALISGIIFGAGTIEQEEIELHALSDARLLSLVDVQKVSFKVLFERRNGDFFTEEFHTVTLACNFISTSI